MSVYSKIRDDLGISKTKFRNKIKPFRNGVRYLGGNETEISFRRSQSEAAKLANLI